MSKLEPRKCAVCDEEYTPGRKNQKNCSVKCGAEAVRIRQRRGKPDESKVCAICEEDFHPERADQKYCSKKCAAEGRRRLNRAAGPLDEVIADAHDRDVERKNKAELKKIIAANHRMERYEKVLTECLVAYDPTPLVVPATPDHALIEKAEHEWILVIGDWHTGQKTTLPQTGGVYEQDIATTRAQVVRIWSAIQDIYRIKSEGQIVKKLHVIGLGDFVDGDDMRPSQHRHVEDVVTVQVIQAFDILAWFLRQLMTIFPDIEVDVVGGNHDRTGRNRGDAGLGELDYIDTYAWLLGAFLVRVFANDIETGRLKIRNWETFFGYKMVAGKRVVFEHGSSFKWGGGYGGVPWYGISALGPRYGQMLGEPDLVLLGHGHRPAMIPHGNGWIIANGALPATSTYVQSSFKTVQRPQQWLLSLHERLGLTDATPLYADIPGTLQPGDIWEDPEHYAQLANQRSEPK